MLKEKDIGGQCGPTFDCVGYKTKEKKGNNSHYMGTCLSNKSSIAKWARAEL